MRLTAAALMLMGPVLAGCAETIAQGTGPVEATASPALLVQVNAARSARNLPSLPEATALTEAARAHAADMTAKGYFDHDAPDGSTPLRRMRAAGFDACYAAETIARGQQTEAQVVTSWTNSPGHAELMFSPNPTAAGTARAGSLWVMTLSRPC